MAELAQTAFGEMLTHTIGFVYAHKASQALKTSLKDTQPVGTIVERVRSLDQAKAVLTFVEAAADKGLRTTVALTAGRGRGKSAALGLALASEHGACSECAGEARAHR